MKAHFTALILGQTLLVAVLVSVCGCATSGPGISTAQNPVTVQVDPHYGKEWQDAATAVDVLNRGLNKNYSAQSARGGQALQGMGMLFDLLSR